MHFIRASSIPFMSIQEKEKVAWLEDVGGGTALLMDGPDISRDFVCRT